MRVWRGMERQQRHGAPWSNVSWSPFWKGCKERCMASAFSSNVG
jgi:hypothetical protein